MGFTIDGGEFDGDECLSGDVSSGGGKGEGESSDQQNNSMSGTSAKFSQLSVSSAEARSGRRGAEAEDRKHLDLGVKMKVFQTDSGSNPDKDWRPLGARCEDRNDYYFDNDGLEEEKKSLEEEYVDTYRKNFRRKGTADRFSSFIPPMPKQNLTNAVQYENMSQPRETEEETRARILENLKQTKYFKQPTPPLPVGKFYVKLVSVTEKSHVMVELQDYQSEFKNLQSNLKMFFFSKTGLQNTKMPVAEIEKGRIVLAKWRDNEYVRAWVIDVNLEKRTVRIRNCDQWVEKTVTVDDMFYMLPCFMNTPFRVQKYKLIGLELWDESKVLYEAMALLRRIICKMRVCESTIDPSNDEPIVCLEIEEDDGAEVSKGITLNTMLRHVISGFTRIPKLFFKGMLLECAHISIAETDGEVWIQMHSGLTCKLSSLGENPRKCDTYRSKSGDPVAEFEMLYFESNQKRFLAKFNEDRSYYRVEVLEATRGVKEVKVHYLDYGNTEVISVEDLLPTQEVDLILNEIPSQVFKGYLNGIDEIIDADEFFDNITALTVQRFMVAGFRAPNVPLLDAYAKIDRENPEEWVYVNQFILEKGWAKGPGVPVPLACGSPKSKPTQAMIPTQQISSKFTTQYSKNRLLSSCRVATERNGLFAYMIRNQY